MTSSLNDLSLILRRLDEIESKLDRLMEEVRATAIGSHNQALFANEGAGVARFRDAKEQTKCEVKP